MPMPAITRIAGIRPMRVGKGANSQSADSVCDGSHRDDFHDEAEGTSSCAGAWRCDNFGQRACA
jgi:hypothetical protein